MYACAAKNIRFHAQPYSREHGYKCYYYYAMYLYKYRTYDHRYRGRRTRRVIGKYVCDATVRNASASVSSCYLPTLIFYSYSIQYIFIGARYLFAIAPPRPRRARYLSTPRGHRVFVRRTVGIVLHTKYLGYKIFE